MADAANGQRLRKIAKETVLELVEDNDTAEIIIEESLTNLPNLRDDMEKALQSDDIATASRHAHSLKGVLSTLGLYEESDYAKECEQSLKAGNKDIDSSKEMLYKAIEDFITV